MMMPAYKGVAYTNQGYQHVCVCVVLLVKPNGLVFGCRNVEQLISTVKKSTNRLDIV
jgi:hypothetical protein